MGNLLRSSICTILLGATSLTFNHAPTPDLEYVAEMNSFIGPDGNYSIKDDPRKYGLSKPDHVVYPMGGYKDSYQSFPDRKLVIECLEMSGNLDELYDQYAKFYVQEVTKTINKYLRPGRKIATMPMSALQHITVDNNPAIRGSMEFMVTDSEGNKLNAPQHYLQITLSQGKKNIYGFIFFNRIPQGEKMQADVIYDVINSFHSLR